MMNASRIAVDPMGQPWILTREGEMYQYHRDRWRQFPGRFKDLAIGASGAVWSLGERDNPHSNESPILHWTGTDWQRIQGTAVGVAVTPHGVPWIVRGDGRVFRLVDGEKWEALPGCLAAITLGPQGSIWGLGPPDKLGPGGYPILRLLDPEDWEMFPGAAIRIAVDSAGVPWVLNDRYEIFRLVDGFSWEEISGMAIDIATGADGSVCAIGRAKPGVPPAIVRWDANRWVPVERDNKSAVVETETDMPQLPVPTPGSASVVYCRDGNGWRKLAGSVREIAIDSDGVPSLTFEDGERIPFKDGGEILIPDKRTRGVRIQLHVKKTTPDAPPLPRPPSAQ
jgi:hypothetical protein